ncbi:iron efflux ABC transporter ATP-binding subunit FetA [Tatumella saanichensis]|uniref:iron efflux ABC transporter ATP-binding subunit FetA n=1 Tax=Tatumella saanichensis TaxID=480813 RepID=UPI0004A25438|nr:iron ABC transporter ATP-binding protein FetA [Tatumella saanichensis]
MKDQQPALLEAKNISYRAGERQILQNVSLNINAGQFMLITGPSGCGKSTLLKIISSLISAEAGEIRLSGKAIDDFTPEHYRQRVSYCSQTPALFGKTVADNLLFPWKLRDKTPPEGKLVADLKRFSLSEEMLNKGINELSGGEKQRVSLIRHLQFLPDVLLLDEITSALDETNKKQVNEIIHQYVKEHQLAVLWVTHDTNEIEHADNVITLENRNKVAEKTKDEQ